MNPGLALVLVIVIVAVITLYGESQYRQGRDAGENKPYQASDWRDKKDDDK